MVEQRVQHAGDLAGKRHGHVQPQPGFPAHAADCRAARPGLYRLAPQCAVLRQAQGHWLEMVPDIRDGLQRRQPAHARKMNTPHNGADALVSIRNLRVAFDDGKAKVPVLHGIDLDIDPGEALGIVGESGCGKSVTWLAVLGLLGARAQVSGTVYLRAEPLHTLRGDQLAPIRGKRIAMIFQDPSCALNPVQRIGRQLTEALTLHRALRGAPARAEALRLLDRVHIPDARQRLDAYPHELSGGMNQRVMIAMALAGEPELLVADEPTTALDTTIQAQILALLAEIRQDRAMALVLISHDPGGIADMCDRGLVVGWWCCGGRCWGGWPRCGRGCWLWTPGGWASRPGASACFSTRSILTHRACWERCPTCTGRPNDWFRSLATCPSLPTCHGVAVLGRAAGSSSPAANCMPLSSARSVSSTMWRVIGRAHDCRPAARRRSRERLARHPGTLAPLPGAQFPMALGQVGQPARGRRCFPAFACGQNPGSGGRIGLRKIHHCPHGARALAGQRRTGAFRGATGAIGARPPLAGFAPADANGLPEPAGCTRPPAARARPGGRAADDFPAGFDGRAQRARTRNDGIGGADAAPDDPLSA